MPTSYNGWTVIHSDQTVKWVIPLKKGEYRHLVLRDGHVGFVLACFAAWFHRKVEKINEGQWDEWGYAYRAVRGQTSGYSCHASGTAIDLNATQHPLGKRGTFKHKWQSAKIRFKLKRWAGVIRWGGDYQNRADEMHFEIIKGAYDVARLAKRLARTRVGKAVLRANPHFRI